MVKAILQTLARVIGVACMWIIGGRKKPFDYYMENTGYLEYFIGFGVFFLIASMIWGFPKLQKGKDEINKHVSYIQEKTDSAALLYKFAIIDYQNGMSKDEVLLKYNYVNVLKVQAASEFDSLTKLYISHHILQADYDSVRNVLKFDSVKYYSGKATEMGLPFK